MARVRMTPGWDKKVQAEVDDALMRVTRAIARDVERYAPVDTGALAGGVTVEGPVAGHARVNVDRDVPGDDPLVPIYVEYGTSKQSAQPFIRPAAYQRRDLS